MSESARRHKLHAAGRAAGCAVLTISDSRTEETDTGGKKILEGLEAHGHRRVAYGIVPDDPERIEERLVAWIDEPEIQVVLTTGGTGISRRDTTIEVVERLLDKPLSGFGELFRMLSWQEIGSPAMLSRAVAGLAQGTFLFSMPGSPNAVALAMERLILPELPHLLWERSR
ncbi:MAG: MogA/MoaB family molybdenum cofactor biosynthesis protein [Acidobacteria bacterium]|nr:MogA/MoaB family molybdenum cofactor biosynthesis protein [Acidobacteriota bacterium]